MDLMPRVGLILVPSNLLAQCNVTMGNQSCSDSVVLLALRLCTLVLCERNSEPVRCLNPVPRLLLQDPTLGSWYPVLMVAVYGWADLLGKLVPGMQQCY